MSNSTQSSSSGGIGFLGMLGILFIALKLTNAVAWSWWVVLLPLYGGLVIAGVILLIYGICCMFRS